MVDVINEAATRYKSLTGQDIIGVYGSSSSLARQINSGAPADIYISANTKWMNFLVNQGEVSPDKVFVLASNQLVLISADTSIKPFDLHDKNLWIRLLTHERLALADPASVPAGLYAKESLQHLGLWPLLQAKIAPTKNVRAALNLVEWQEAPLGIVYASDIMFSQKVHRVADIPSAWHSPILYVTAGLNLSQATENALQFLKSDDFVGILHKYGFQ